MNEPSLLYFLFTIAGAAALLIWSARLVRTGVEDAFAIPLRRFLQRSDKRRAQAMITGGFAALCLQSATAVAVLIANFANKGSLRLVTGLAIIFGADLGSAVVSQVLLVERDFIIPLLLLPGVGLYLRGEKAGARSYGRILIGVGLIFVSLDMIRMATAPLMDNPAVLTLMSYLNQDVILAFVIGAAFTWLVHSSVASVLFFVTLVGQGLLPMDAAVALVLGANLGGALVAYTMTMSSGLEARRIMTVNLMVRGALAVGLLILMQRIALLGWLEVSAAQRVITLHMAFNFCLALLSLPFLGLLARLIEWLMPERPDLSHSSILSSNLDTSTLSTPSRAFACARREVIRMGETVEGMLRTMIILFQNWDERVEQAVSERVEEVRDMHEQIKQFLAQLPPDKMSSDERRQSDQLASIALNLEFAAEAIGIRLIEQAQQLKDEGFAFSEQGMSEITEFHDRVLVNAQRALNTLVTQSPEDAQQLMKAKEKVRKIERDLQTKHLSRLREKVPESYETSRIHQETLRMLKSINTAFAMIGYDVAKGSHKAALSAPTKKKKNAAATIRGKKTNA
jgi:phosphate:Na+ symporter